MKIYIATDLEGISGVTFWDQTRDRTHYLYREARHLLTADINACVEGCIAGGAKDTVVSDGHGGGLQHRPGRAAPRGELRHRPWSAAPRLRNG